MKKYYVLFLIVIALFTLSQFSCHSPTAPNSGLTLTLSDVSCTEAWLNLSAGSLPLPANIIINKNGNNFLSFTLTKSDTTLYDSTLSPNQTYTYQAVYGGNKSETVTAKTMDTTSSNFTFQKFYLGGATSSMLNDVAIINDTLAYVVGKIYVNDSTGAVDQSPYNLAKWDGHFWQLIRIQFYTVRGNTHLTSYPTSSIFVLGDNNIWISMDGDQIAKWDGKTQIDTMFLPNSFPIKKMWGGNSNLKYAVGSNGNIDYYLNSSWQKIENRTSLDIQDIFGYSNSNQTEVYCIASDLFTANGNMVLQINGSQVKAVSNKGLPVYSFSSIWLNNPDKAYLAGNGIYINNSFSTDGAWKELQPRASNDYLNSIRGNDVNDIVAAGAFGEVVFFNGVRWVSYLSQTGLSSGEYLSVAIKGNEIIAVGYEGAKAVIAVGKR